MSRSRRLKKKMKNIFTSVLTLLLIIGVSVGVTMALLWGKSNAKTNTFTGSKGVNVILSEENWDGSTADSDGKPVGKNGTTINENELTSDKLDSDKGYVMATNYTPKMEIPKNPIMTNKSEKEKVWVMLRIQYLINTKPDGTTDTKIPVLEKEFQKLAKTQDNSTNVINPKWAAISGNPAEGSIDTDGYYYYYYLDKLDKSDGTEVATEPLFEKILINETIGWAEIDEVKRYQVTPANTTTYSETYYTYAILPEFQIKIEGAAISVEENDPEDLNTAVDVSGGRTKEEIRTALKEIFEKSGTSGS